MHATILLQGRSIQKPYVAGDEAAYAQDLISRYQHGEFFSQDSIKHQGPAYHTNNGRIVYGGGGITPDIFVPEDTSKVTSYYKEAVVSGLMLQYAFNYTDKNRKKLSGFGEVLPLANYLDHQNLVGDFVGFAEKNGLRRRNLMIMRSHSLLQEYLNSRIIYNILDEQAWIEYVNRNDAMIKAAVNAFHPKSLLLLKPRLKSADKSMLMRKRKV